MFDFELKGKRENIDGNDLFVMYMMKGDKTKHCAIEYNLVDLSITDEDLKSFIDKGFPVELAKKKLIRDKKQSLLDSLRAGIESMIASFLEDK